MNKKITFNEPYRPQFDRGNQIDLCGKWDFRFDNDNVGEENGYKAGFEKEYDIIVPFAYETPASGINIQKRCDHVWYQKRVNINKKDGKEYVLHLEGSDFVTSLYVNGKFVASDTGAYHRINFKITDFITNGENLIVIKCDDDYSCEKNRGKQRWRDESFECFYVDTTGIYKPVWLEEMDVLHVCNVKITPNLKDKKVLLEYKTKKIVGCDLVSTIYFDGKEVANNVSKVEDIKTTVEINLPDPIMAWSCKTPNLYDLVIEVKKDGVTRDKVNSYFGVREVIAKDGFVYMNGEKFYQKLILDQGYWIEGHLTPLNAQQLYDDIVKMQELGFNGCRKHQKQEDERFLYYADVLGYVMWSEMPSMYENTTLGRANFEKEWVRIVEQNYNHPCIIAWTTLNESWGIPNIKTRKVEQDFANLIYHVTKEYDANRFVLTNDGWEHTLSDLLTIHHYEQDGEKLYSYYDTIEKALSEKWEAHGKGMFADGYGYHGQPILVSEFGGTAHERNTKDSKNWGYGVAVKDDEAYVKRLDGLFTALYKLDYLSGYCYTQLSDVQQEVNGLLFENRENKVPAKLIRDILDKNEK